MAVSDKYTAQAFIYVDNLLMEAQSVNWGLEYSDTDIVTADGGFVGRNKGARKLAIQAETVIPSDASNVAYLEKCARDMKIVELVMFVGDKSLTSKGFIDSPKGDWSIDAKLGFSFAFMGEPAILE